MAGHVQKKRPGVWEMRVYLGRDPLTRKKIWETGTVEADTKKAAQLACDQFALEVRRTKLDARGMTVGELLERWYQHGVARDLWSPATEVLHRRKIDGHLNALADQPLREIDSIAIDDFYDALRIRGGPKQAPLSVATVRRTAGVLSLALDQAVRWKLITHNPAKDAQPGKHKYKKAATPATDQVVALLAAAEARDPEWLCYLFLDAEAGARRGEVAALRLSDFGADCVTIARALATGHASEKNAAKFAGHYWPSRWDRGSIRTALIEKEPKTEESIRTIALSPHTMRLVREQATRVTQRLALAGRPYPPNGFLFPAPGDGLRPVRPDSWTDRFASLRAELGLTGVKLHGLRHYVATTLLNSGVDIPTVAGRLGHGGGGKTTISIYGHASAAVDRSASELMSGILLEDTVSDSAELLPDNVVAIAGRPAKEATTR